jgi:hypothetical protein
MTAKCETLIICCAGLLAGLGEACAQDFGSASARGTSGAQFLELPVNARAIAMGSAYAAIADDASALTYNPAALSQVSEGSVVLMHAMYLQNMSYDYAAIATAHDGWTFGAQAQMMNYGSFSEVDNTGASTGGTFSPSDIAFGFGFSRNIGPLSIGGGAKYISSKIYDSATTYAFDAGLLLRLGGGLRLGLSALDMGSGMTYISQQDPLPTTLHAGLGYVGEHIVLTAEAVAPRDGDMYFAGGGEYRTFLTETIGVALRAGYNGQTSASGLGGNTGLNAGGGISFGNLGVDYAWSPFADLGTAHRFSIDYSW